MYQFAAPKKLVFDVRLYDVDLGSGVFWGSSDSFIICVEISAQIADFVGGRKTPSRLLYDRSSLRQLRRSLKPQKEVSDPSVDSCGER